MKTCNKCKEYKSFSNFNKDKSIKDGFNRTCRICMNNYKISLERTEKYKLVHRKYRENEENKKIAYEYHKSWRKKNILKRSEYNKKRCADAQFILVRKIRGIAYNAIIGGCKSEKYIESLGCTPEKLKLHLESKFQEGMSWDNYGRVNKNNSTWNIDHIIPVSSFDLTDENQFLRACHYTNLQPLWSKDNLLKRHQDEDVDYSRFKGEGVAELIEEQI